MLLLNHEPWTLDMAANCSLQNLGQVNKLFITKDSAGVPNIPKEIGPSLTERLKGRKVPHQYFQKY